MQQRSEGIWKGLFQFPLIEMPAEVETAELLESADLQEWVPGNFTLEEVQPLKPHKLSHQTLHISVLRMKTEEFPKPVSGCKAVHWRSLDELAFPRPLRQYLDEKQLTLRFF